MITLLTKKFLIEQGLEYHMLYYVELIVESNKSENSGS